MDKRRAVILPMLLLVLTVLFAGAGAVKAEALDLDRTISLKVLPGPASMTELDDSNVSVDLYKIADAKEDGSAYSFTLKSGITLSKPVDTYAAMAELDNTAWLGLAQDAARSVIKPEASPVGAETDLSALTSGLYLIIAHGAGLAEEEYAVWDDSGDLTTQAFVGENTYTWYPELVALPSTVSEMGKDGERSAVTITGGDWQYEITATLKPSVGQVYGDLNIVKKLPVYETTTPTTFVFSVVATFNGETVYDDVCSLTFSSSGSETYEIVGKLPIGAEVTVTEVYSGAGYSIDDAGNKTQTVTITSADEAAAATVTFENTYDEEHKNGYGILNEFTYGENGWTVHQN